MAAAAAAATAAPVTSTSAGQIEGGGGGGGGSSMNPAAVVAPSVAGSVSEQQHNRQAPNRREGTPDDEIRVTNLGRVTMYVSYAARLFLEQHKTTIVIRASGFAIPSAISTVEILKRRFVGLHQLTTGGISQLADSRESIADKKPRTRHVPFISITLSTDGASLDQSSPGYQSPLDPSLVKELRDFSTNPDGTARINRGGIGGGGPRGGRGGMRGGMRGRGRGGRGRRGGRGGPPPAVTGSTKPQHLVGGQQPQQQQAQHAPQAGTTRALPTGDGGVSGGYQVEQSLA